MDITKDPATGTVRVDTTRGEIRALRNRVEDFNAFSGSDEWDLNSAWRDGFNAALDIFTGIRLAADSLVNAEVD